ncbi:MAG: hypothetical protein DRG09_04615 [Epsilonproteobacteria bacterium]|nr:MAG: hypothetical protein DRG09_04615 [Campylobacterota bacterium]
MHRLLKRQLEKIGYTKGKLSEDRMKKFISFVDREYYDNDEDRVLLENTLNASSKEMQGLYKQLKETSENQLAQSEEKYHRLVKNLQSYYFFYSHDADGIVTYVSESITKMLGYSTEEFLKHYLEYLTDDPINERVEEYSNKALMGINPPPYELSIFHKNGSVLYLEVTEHPVFNDKGEIEAVECIARDITSQYKAKEEIEHLAQHDMLTGISNRLHLEEQLKYLISYSKRNDNKFAMLFLDLDHFKQINDTLGHDVGDKLLQEVAKRIKKNIRSEDIFARIGGDEFIIVFTDIEETDLTASIHKILDLIHQPWHIEKTVLNVYASIGVSVYPQDGETAVDLMKSADIAMYKSKELGRNNFTFFTHDLNEKVHEEMKLEQDMPNALSQNQFELYFQPILNLESNEVVGAEALVRWNHPVWGLTYPEKFIKIAESTGFIIKLGTWVIEEGCRMLSKLNAMSAEKINFSVNVSTRQFQQGDLYSIIKSALKKYGVEPGQLSIEITENLLLENHENIINKLNAIKSLGVNISMDDFGMGYSSLSYLHRLPIDIIKVDKNFVMQISEDGGKAVLLDTIIAMGKSLNKTVVAEGVEYEYQRQYLIKNGCINYQGYLFSKPLKESEFSQIIARRR